MLDQPLRLCGRADGDPSRSYEGSLAQLALFDRALGPLDVQALHARVADAGGEAPAGGALGGWAGGCSGWAPCGRWLSVRALA